MRSRTLKVLGALWAASVMAAAAALADSGSWVGNGDDGSDLEGFAPLTSEKIQGARKQAQELLKKLNVAGVPGLGLLEPELEHSSLFMAKRDSDAKITADQGSFHTDVKGRVFARTLAEPHAPTRFFPVAEKLDEDQLVALHVHEALHRALPASVRENEAVVSELALAIVGPESSYDRVRASAAKLIPAEEPAKAVHASAAPMPGESSTLEAGSVAPEGSLAVKPSMLAYEFRNYWANPAVPVNYGVSRMHRLESFLHPFGSRQTSFGMGIEASLIQQPSSTVMGPLGLSGRLRLWSGRGFDVAAWGTLSLNMLSAEELKNSPFGRDVGTLGLDIRKDLKFFYIDNVLSYSLPGSATQTIGRVDYKYEYGGVVNASVHAGASLAFIKAGLYAEIFLADYFRASGGAFDPYDTGRYRLVSAGPEATIRIGDVALSAYGKFLLSAPEDVSFDTLGNLMGPGSGQASLGVRASLYF